MSEYSYGDLIEPNVYWLFNRWLLLSTRNGYFSKTRMLLVILKSKVDDDCLLFFFVILFYFTVTRTWKLRKYAVHFPFITKNATALVENVLHMLADRKAITENVREGPHFNHSSLGRKCLKWYRTRGTGYQLCTCTQHVVRDCT